MGQSRNENILENMLGASNPLGEPQSREESLLMQLLDKLKNLETAVRWKGVTTTELTDGATTNPITINSDSYTAVTGDMVSYGADEFVFNGTIWQKFGGTPEPFIVNYSCESAEADPTLDKTLNEIVEAYNAGKIVRLKIPSGSYIGSVRGTYCDADMLLIGVSNYGQEISFGCTSNGFAGDNLYIVYIDIDNFGEDLNYHVTYESIV